ncbi:MAG TPA: Hsp20/alpha crystallin family protein [Oculatellaceae cyanobacterium]|jgi:HSP20 family protein
MTIVRWKPSLETDSLRRQFDRLFYDLDPISFDSFNLYPESTIFPELKIEIEETDSSILVRAEVPGIDPKNLDVEVSPYAVYITGENRYEKQSEDRGYVRSQLSYSKFQRVIPMPAEVKPQQVKTELKNGVLTLNLPKLDSGDQQVYKVRLAQSEPQIIAGEEKFRSRKGLQAVSQKLKAGMNKLSEWLNQPLKLPRWFRFNKQ